MPGVAGAEPRLHSPDPSAMCLAVLDEPPITPGSTPWVSTLKHPCAPAGPLTHADRPAPAAVREQAANASTAALEARRPRRRGAGHERSTMPVCMSRASESPWPLLDAVAGHIRVRPRQSSSSADRGSTWCCRSPPENGPHAGSGSAVLDQVRRATFFSVEPHTRFGHCSHSAARPDASDSIAFAHRDRAGWEGEGEAASCVLVGGRSEEQNCAARSGRAGVSARGRPESAKARVCVVAFTLSDVAPSRRARGGVREGVRQRRGRPGDAEMAACGRERNLGR